MAMSTLEFSELKKIAFCGRPNVGKSSLFNRLIGRKQALVLDVPGVTRDVKTATAFIEGVAVEFADLAGLEMVWDDRTFQSSGVDPRLHKLAMEAALEYLKGADLAILVIDGRSDISPADQEIARLIRSRAKNILVCVSKAESIDENNALALTAELGFDSPVLTSAEHNMGMTTLREAILEKLNLSPVNIDQNGLEESDAPRRKRAGDKGTERLIVTAKGSDVSHPITMGVYGRPNVGKSTMVNALLGLKRMIVSPIAGTTVDPVDTHFERDGTHFCLVDTAGIRRRSKTEEGIEVLSVVQALKTIDRVDVAFFVVDGFEGITDQDEKVAGRLAEAGRPTIVVVNKWDLCRTDKEDYAKRLRETVPFLDYAPVIFACAEKGQGLEPIFDLVPKMLEERMRTAPTGELNRIVQACVEKVSSRGVKAYYCLQVSKNPPTISIQVNDPKKVHYSLEGHIKNELRAHFGWMGSPLKVMFRGRSGKQQVSN